MQRRPLVATLGSYQVLPTVPAAGLDELQEKVAAMLDKFKALPVEKTVNNATQPKNSSTVVTLSVAKCQKTRWLRAK
jgi:hypothetical protein